MGNNANFRKWRFNQQHLLLLTILKLNLMDYKVILIAGNKYLTVSQDVEPIKEGDWYYHSVAKEIRQWNTSLEFVAYDICRKIIATTDPKLVTCDGIKREGESCSKNNNCTFPNCQVPQLY